MAAQVGEAWEARDQISSGVLSTFDRSEGSPGVAGHNWLTADLVKVECLITEPGGMRLRGNAVVLVGEDDLLDAFERLAPLSLDAASTHARGRGRGIEAGVCGARCRAI
jgi:hypothetical protein